MAERRRIVTDNSVAIEAHFPGDDSRLASRAARIMTAVRMGEVVDFAPDVLVQEFVKVSFDLSSRRLSAPLDLSVVQTQLASFLRLPIVYYPSLDLVATAMDHVLHLGARCVVLGGRRARRSRVVDQP